MIYTPKLITVLVIFILLAYFIGSLNFAIIYSILFKKDDIRKHGSGNAGLTNILRTHGKLAALFTLCGDILKGIFAILIARFAFYHFAEIPNFVVGDYLIMYSVILGHIFPVYYGFKGGKGILTTFGMLLLVIPYAGLVAFGGFILVVLLTRYVSLGSIIACILYPLAVIFFRGIEINAFPLAEFLLSLPISVLISYMHRKNIVRLFKGTENKISFNKK